MNRFMPDTLRDALWRPIAMAVPDAGLYIEFLAPDLRFALLLMLMVLSVSLGMFAQRRQPAQGLSSTWLLVAFTWIAFIPWLMTSGNGRYFIPVLLLAGPLCIALIHKLPFTASFRISAALIVIAAQATAIVLNNPWGRWPLVPWTQPYFQLTLTEQERTRPAAYVTITPISYSLIAPMFPPSSRWMNIASLRAAAPPSADDLRAQQFLQRATRESLPLKVIAPTVPQYMDDKHQPSDVMRNQMNTQLGAHSMRLVPGQACTMAPSLTVAALAEGDSRENAKIDKAKFGFWICNLQYPIAAPAQRVQAPGPQEALAARVFAQLERACPRLFPAGSGVSTRMRGGVSRTYAASDMRAYVLENGEVLYKYWRALNPERIASTTEVMADGFRMDCTRIRGRAGLPWEKQI